MGEHKVIDLNQEIPSADSIENFLLRDVVGNKTDAAAIPSNTTSVIAGLKKVYSEVVSITIAGELFYISSPANLEIDDIGNYNMGLYDVGDGIPTSAEITAGNYQIDRVRNGVLTNIVASTGASKADGRIYCSETFDAASGWATGDLVLVTFSGGSVTPTGGSTTTLPNAYLYSRIVRGETIEGYTKKIYDETFGVSPADGSLASFIATGGTALGTRLPASKSLYDVIVVDRLSGGEYTGTVSAGTAAETTLKEITTSTRIKIESIWLDLTLLVTADATIKLYHKIDGTNYRVFETDAWALTDDDGVLITGFTINNDFKITITGGEAAGVSIPYNIIYQVME